MPNYHRSHMAGGTFFLTLVTYNRIPLFSNPENVRHLRCAVAAIKSEMPFEVVGAVVLPEHIHFLWTLPCGDYAYAKRVGRLKVLVTQSLRGKQSLPQNVSLSRSKHRESDVWQRRFWEHTIRDEADFERHLDYIHYNPVKHHLAPCPHLWRHSSFHTWVRKGIYVVDWGCICSGGQPRIPDFTEVAKRMGE